ncbi:MAG: prepilin-type N-terminal cleavage/methylation domain-containing protein [Candidatus Gracilibacteria bacterium]|nr:prepilin-type N-terminal cleavage/methylation domain-containing protein [Candidatus Gracilibacteria bacterium]
MQNFSIPFHRPDKKGFTILELMVGIVVFTLGFLGSYLLVDSASNASIRSRDEIIGANIMRGQIELLKNLRDTNWIQFRSWNSIELARSSVETENVLQPNTYYTIANNFSAGKTIRIEKLSLLSLSKEAIVQEFQKDNSSIRLCIDSLGRYVHDCTGTNLKTNYASFLFLEPLVTRNILTNTLIPVDRAYKVTVFFVSLNKGYRLSDMNTLITDWKNQ